MSQGKQRLGMFIYTAIGLIIAYGLFRSVYTTWQKRDIVQERKQELMSIEADNLKLKQALEEAQSPEFIEQEIRNRLGMTKPGETVVIFSSPLQATSGASVGETLAPSWRLWWGLFF